MTPNEMRIAIAETCGWRVENYGPKGYETLYWRLRDPSGQVVPQTRECTGEAWSREIFMYFTPNYPADLDAMHEAEKVLTPMQQGAYLSHIREIIHKATVGPNGTIATPIIDTWYWHATASQRAEAFCRTLYPERFK